MYDDEQYDIVARTVYGEARGEYNSQNGGIASLIAVANVICNRTKQKRYGKTPKEVCLRPYQFSCWNSNDPNKEIIEQVNTSDPIFSLCLNVSKYVLDEKWPDLTKGSDHYHTKAIYPYWCAKKRPEVIIGNHLFYKLGGQ